MTTSGQGRAGSGLLPGQILRLLGPAFVASVAYVDPGNVAANLSAGGRYGYRLVWVLAAASVMAMLVQFQSAKLGLVSGRTLPQVMTERFARSRLHTPLTWGYGLQAFVIAIATDIAEVVGGALGLGLLFGTPLWLGGIIVGLVSLALLAGLRNRGERAFEFGVGALLTIVAAGFIGTLFFRPPDWTATVAGLLPSVPDQAALPLIAAMLGATVMPHAIYLHSGLAIDRFRPEGTLPAVGLKRLLRVQRIDVVLALVVSGSVNIAMLLLGATILGGGGAATIESAHAGLAATLGPAAAAVFAIGLLASGIGSAVVGTHAGSRILKDMRLWQVSPLVRRTLTIAPAVVLLLLGAPPTSVLIWSQVVLSFGIAFAAIPLAVVTADRALMGDHADRGWQRLVNWTVVALIVALNLSTVWWAAFGG
ncbi:MAG: Nramp family divalent metal transporter [Propionibacteriales bacterium]|nr:Nramp family divalent metal transporter [Propionibacteriales bacterium]